jgi:hypothetical protein
MNVFKGFAAIAAFGVTAYFATPAQAGPTGLSLGLERAFGYTSTSVTTESGGVENTQTTSEFTLGLSTTSARLGIDYILRSGLSFGTGFGYGTASTEFEGDTVDGDGASTDRLLLSPRIGYLAMFTRDFGIWPRGGITFASTTTETPDTLLGGDNELSRSDILLTLEAPLVIMPSESFGFALSPSLDWMLSSTVELDGNEVDGEISGHQLGVLFGVFGVL